MNKYIDNVTIKEYEQINRWLKDIVEPKLKEKMQQTGEQKGNGIQQKDKKEWGSFHVLEKPINLLHLKSEIEKICIVYYHVWEKRRLYIWIIYYV